MEGMKPMNIPGMITDLSRAKHHRKTTDQAGMTTVIAVMVLALLSIMGISALTTSRFEVQIADNDRTYKRNLAFAEGATAEAAQVLRNARTTPVQLRKRTLTGMFATDDESANMQDLVNWYDSDMAYKRTTSVVDANTQYSANDYKRSGSLSLSNRSSLHQIAIYGLYNETQAKDLVMVRIGYMIRY